MNGTARWPFGAAIVLLSLFAVSCDTSEAEREFTDDFLKFPAGYTAILDRQFGGEVCSPVDDDDWRVNPLYRSQVLSVDAAMPNPSSSGIITVLLNVVATDRFVGALILNGIRQDGSEVNLHPGLIPGSGFMVFQFNSSELSTEPDLYRIYVADRRSVITYGDIKIVNQYPADCQEALAN